MTSRFFILNKIPHFTTRFLPNIWRNFIDRSADQPGHEICNFAQKLESKNHDVIICLNNVISNVRVSSSHIFSHLLITSRTFDTCFVRFVTRLKLINHLTTRKKSAIYFTFLLFCVERREDQTHISEGIHAASCRNSSCLAKTWF